MTFNEIKKYISSANIYLTKFCYSWGNELNLNSVFNSDLNQNSTLKNDIWMLISLRAFKELSQ